MAELSIPPYGISTTKRFTSPTGEALLYVQKQAGSDSSFVELIDYMGGDGTVERAATAGHGRDIFPEHPSQEDLFTTLARRKILMPFKSVHLKFRIQSSIRDALDIVYAQAAEVNEYSGRYSEMPESSFIPSIEYLAAKMEGASRKEATDRAKRAHDLIAEDRAINFRDYKQLISKDIDLARELARAPLEINNDTSYIWKIDLLSLYAFITEKRARLGDKKDSLHAFLNLLETAAQAVAPVAYARLYTPGPAVKLSYPRDANIVDPAPLPAAWKPSETKRVTVPALEEILFVRQPLLANGAVQAVDYMGDDRGPVESARISYGTGTVRLQEDAKLTKYLFRHRHTTPFEACELAVESKTPIFVDPRQAARHRTLDNDCFMGETLVGNQFFVPPANEMKHQDRKNRQGRGNELDDELKESVTSIMKGAYERKLQLVEKLEDLDVPQDEIRRVKGVGFYTYRWRTGDLKNWLHFLGLRWDAHAQKEIFLYAEQVADIIRRQAPSSLEALNDYQREAVTFTRQDKAFLKKALVEIDADNLDLYRPLGFVTTDKKDREVLTREGEELKAKIKKCQA